ncbi:Uu.00g029650.m01.CDS01 [Anthostomella pinea]|uniref:Uu.00g029650.m01.CDS01 n=1 Tax=Anthostomella pinea TaxID=933095 RepID=A0AAI8V8R6_9PEZI|nr:Uu.00g029650.m01.CDS01 [Anthostomella pinea]
MKTSFLAMLMAAWAAVAAPNDKRSSSLAARDKSVAEALKAWNPPSSDHQRLVDITDDNKSDSDVKALDKGLVERSLARTRRTHDVCDAGRYYCDTVEDCYKKNKEHDCEYTACGNKSWLGGDWRVQRCM